jgi:hypothetical protein
MLQGRQSSGKKPLAFFEQKPNAYNDTNEIGKWCRERGDFSESICQQVERYFTSPIASQAMRSFASLPITSRLDNVRLGVLNLHSSRANLLFGEGTPSQFFPLTQPFIGMLTDLWSSQSKKKELLRRRTTKLRPHEHRLSLVREADIVLQPMER